MRCVIIGICQLEAVSKILASVPSFTARYPEREVYLVFGISAEEMARILREVVPKADLVISQPVSRAYRGDPVFSTGTLRKAVREGAKHLVVSNCYFTGYDPAPFQTTTSEGEILHIEELSYYPALAVPHLLEQDVEGAAKAWCDPDAYSRQEAESNALRSLRSLKEREERVFEEPFGVDVTISDFVEREWRKAHLFHTYNHPTNLLLLELAKRVAAAAGVPWSRPEDEKLLSSELLGDSSIPPPPSVYFGAGLTFPCPRFTLRGREMSTRRALEAMSQALAKGDPALKPRWLADARAKIKK